MDKMVKWRKPSIGIACSTDSFYSAIETIINQHPIRGPHQRNKYNQLLSILLLLSIFYYLLFALVNSNSCMKLLCYSGLEF